MSSFTSLLLLLPLPPLLHHHHRKPSMNEHWPVAFSRSGTTALNSNAQVLSPSSMSSLPGTALACLRNHVLVFHSDTLYSFPESLTENFTESPSQLYTPENVGEVPFPLYSFDTLAISGNLILCCPSPNTLAVFQCETHSTSGTLLPPIPVATWAIPNHYKISVACWASSEPGSNSSNSSNPTYQQQHALLGTRDGTILRLDLQQPGILFPVNIDGSPSASLQSSTISSIAAAPCGDGFYAVGYASGMISIFQNTKDGMKTTHNIESSKKVLALSWHYSCKNKSSQSLATLHAGSDRLHIYTIDVTSNSKTPRKIRDIPLPQGQRTPSNCSKFLQWSKGGKVIRVSDAGLVASDVRTKNVVTQSIPLATSVAALGVKSSNGKVWVVNGEGSLNLYNLVDGSLVHSTLLPFSETMESAAIFDSPVVYFHRPAQVLAVTYKNKRAMKSPVSAAPSLVENSPTESRPSSYSPGNSSNSSPTTFTFCEDKLDKRPVSPPSKLPTTFPHLAHNANSSEIDNEDKTIKLFKLHIKATTTSLFPIVTKTLLHMSPHQSVPEFIPSLSTREQYAISAIFGGVFSTPLCLGGIVDILQEALSKESDSLRSLVFSLFLSDISLNRLITTVGKLPGEKRFSDRFVFTLLSIASLAGGSRHSSALSFSSSRMSSSQRCNTELVNLVQDLIDTELPSEDFHLICAYLVSVGCHLEACRIYLNSGFFLEAFMVSLLGKLEFLSVFRQWCFHLRSTSENPSLMLYLGEISANLSGLPRHSTTSTNSSSLDETINEPFLTHQLSAFLQSGGHPMREGRTEVDDVAIFSPELGLGEFTSSSLDGDANPPAMSSNRIMLLSTPKAANLSLRHKHKHAFSNPIVNSASSSPLDVVASPPIQSYNRFTLSSQLRS